MTLTPLDWAIVAGLLATLTFAATRTQRYATSVAGFLAAERCAGRYLISVAFNMAQLGVITLVWYFQQNYDVGFTSIWWGLMEGPAMILVALSGWVIYRFRRTRAMTLAQFFEQRYSKSFRVFAGLIAFISGIINYGIFPGVAARFFIGLCGLPATFSLAGTTFSTFFTLMVLLMAIALFFVFLGGQIAVMVTDFLQGVFSNVTFLILIGFLMFTIPWEHMADVLMGRVWEGAFVAKDVVGAVNPLAGRSMIDPFDLGKEENFNVFYWLISVVVLFYGMRAWQGDQGYNAAAKNAHEARMANILNGWRFRVLMLITIVLPLAIRTLMHHPAYAEPAAAVQATLDTLATDALKSETRTPLATAQLLPVGLLGLFAAAMLGAFVSTNDTYLHSWGSIFVQDVVLPFRKKPLSTRAHLRLLKSAIFGVAIFALLFSYYYEPSQYISMFLALTGAVFVGGAGSAIIGGLYWKRGSTPGAWTAMTVGLCFSTFGIVVKQQFVGAMLLKEKLAAYGIESFGTRPAWLDPEVLAQAQIAALELAKVTPLSDTLLWIHTNDFITGQILTFVTIVLSIASYVGVSLLGPRHEHDLDKLLHRGAYEVEADRVIDKEQHAPWLQKLGFDPEFTGSDKWITLVTVLYPLVWTVIFLVGTAYVWKFGAEAESWLAWWHGWLWFVFGLGIVIMTWFTIGGARDLRAMFRHLRSLEVDTSDDGLGK
ncbi:MAG: sodium:solute symporter [Planctomycetota bacterium]|nr:sodium:solute symporter [Planctomycetota bacterium]